jgi:hypothetical protein
MARHGVAVIQERIPGHGPRDTRRSSAMHTDALEPKFGSPNFTTRDEVGWLETTCFGEVVKSQCRKDKWLPPPPPFPTHEKM